MLEEKQQMLHFMDQPMIMCQYGWTTCVVLVLKNICLTAALMDGGTITVPTVKMLE